MLVASVFACCAATTVAAQQAARAASPTAPQDSTLNFGIVTKGGISLGSYMAGANWVLVEIAKRLREPRYRARLSADSVFLPRMRLLLTAGASAGNINALLGAIEWCSPIERLPPDVSLFWRMWNAVGWEQLEPKASGVVDTSDAALLERHFFRDELLPELRRRLAVMDSTRCRDLPVGVTLTRVVPHQIDLAGARIPVQRFASVVVLRRDVEAATGRGSLHLYAPDSVITGQRALGEQVVLAGGEQRQPYDPALVLRLAEASSSFPVAFAPRVLRHYPVSHDAPEWRRYSKGCPRDVQDACVGLRQAAFMDGGLFDNLPVSLALGLEAAVGETRERSKDVIAQGSDSTVPAGLTACLAGEGSCDDVRYRIIALAPDVTRRANPAPPPPMAEESSQGLSPVFAMLGGAVGAARNYELAVLARQRQGGLRFVTRAHEVVGARMGAFGAFFGRPFRDHDFFVGVYDGLRFVAQQLSCGQQPSQALDPCTRRVLAVLLNHEYLRTQLDLDIGELAPRVIASALHEEHPGQVTLPAPPMVSPGLRHRLAAVEAVDYARRAISWHAEAPPCESNIFVQATLCDGRFREMVDSTRAYLEQNLDGAERCDDDVGCWSRVLGSGADGPFVGLLAAPEDFMAQLVLRSVERLASAEGTLGGLKRSNRRALVDLVELVRASSMERYRRGLWLDPSTTPRHIRYGLAIPGAAASVHIDRGRAASAIWRAVPYHVAGTIGMSGTLFGWKPTWYPPRGAALSRLPFMRSVAVTFPIDVLHLGPCHCQPSPNATARADIRGWYPGASVGLQFHVPRTLINSVEVQTGGYARLNDEPLRGSAAVVNGLWVGVLTRVIGGKVELALRRQPRALERWSSESGRLLGTIGVADINGLSYWIWRFASAG